MNEDDFMSMEMEYVGLLGRTPGVRQKYLVSIVNDHGIDILHDMLYMLKKKCLDKMDLKVIAKDLEYIDTYDFEIVCKLYELRKLRENAKKLKKEARSKESKQRQELRAKELHLSNYGYRTRKPVNYRMNCINAAIKEWGVENVLKRMMALSHYHESIGQDMQALFKSMNKSERAKNMDLLADDDSFGFLDSDDEDEPLSDEDDTSVYGFKQNGSVRLSNSRIISRGSSSSNSSRGGRRGERGERGVPGGRGGRGGHSGTTSSKGRNRRESYSTTSLEYSEDTITLTMDEFSEMKDEMNRLRQMHLSSLKALDKFEKKLKK